MGRHRPGDAQGAAGAEKRGWDRSGACDDRGSTRGRKLMRTTAMVHARAMEDV
jgi:hypothetical protein